MSRIGKQPVKVPSGVKLKIDENNLLSAEGPKGKLTRQLPQGINVELKDGQVVVTRVDDSNPQRALHGLTRTLVSNTVTGVAEGFTRQLEIIGVGYKAAVEGKTLVMHLGYSHPVRVEPPPGVEFAVEQVRGLGFAVTVKGIDKEQLGQLCANIRAIRAPEPYKGKGIRYKGEVIIRKMGKAGKTGK